MKTRMLSLGVIAILLLSFVGRAAEMGHYFPAIANNLDFFVPEKGLYYLQYHFNYHSDDYRDNDGDKVDDFSLDLSATRSGSIPLRNGVSAKATATANAKVQGNLKYDFEIRGFAPTLAYVTDKKFLGAKVGMFVAIPFMYIKSDIDLDATVNTNVNLTLDANLPGGGNQRLNMSANDERAVSLSGIGSQFDLGDIFVQPVWLGWDGKHYSASFGYGVYAPTGDFDDGELDNTGLGYWTHQIQGAAAIYPWEHRATSIISAITYEMHGEKQDADLTPGEHLTINYGVSQMLPLKKDKSLLLELGATGYSRFQVGRDIGSGVTHNNNFTQEVHGLGFETGVISPGKLFQIKFKAVKEYGARNSLQGNFFGLTLSKGF